jgi:hypothetical protein
MVAVNKLVAHHGTRKTVEDGTAHAKLVQVIVRKMFDDGFHLSTYYFQYRDKDSARRTQMQIFLHLLSRSLSKTRRVKDRVSRAILQILCKPNAKKSDFLLRRSQN